MYAMQPEHARIDAVAKVQYLWIVTLISTYSVRSTLAIGLSASSGQQRSILGAVSTAGGTGCEHARPQPASLPRPLTVCLALHPRFPTAGFATRLEHRRNVKGRLR